MEFFSLNISASVFLYNYPLWFNGFVRKDGVVNSKLYKTLQHNATILAALQMKLLHIKIQVSDLNLGVVEFLFLKIKK